MYSAAAEVVPQAFFPPVIGCIRCRNGILRNSGERPESLRCDRCGYLPETIEGILDLEGQSKTNHQWAHYHGAQKRVLRSDRACGNRGYPQYRHLFRPLEPFLEGSVLLDLGCGMGQAVFGPHHPKYKHYSYVGIDSSLQSLRLARQYIEDGRFVCSSIETLVLAPSSVDIIVCFGILMYVSSPIDLLSKLVRALKPGGRLLLHEPILRFENPPRSAAPEWVAGSPLNGQEVLDTLRRWCSIETVHKEYSPLRTVLVRLFGGQAEKSVIVTRLMLGLDALFIRLAGPLSSRLGAGSMLVSARRRTGDFIE
jgi:SAM-dependent methyltransferase